MRYIATFHSHFGAMSFSGKLKKLGQEGVMMPVPRQVSSSCGTCVRFDCDFDSSSMVVEDMEKVFELQDGKYREIFQNEE